VDEIRLNVINIDHWWVRNIRIFDIIHGVEIGSCKSSEGFCMKNVKMIVRPPLAPIAEDMKCKEQYEKLLAEFAELEALKVKDVDGFIHDEDPVVTLDEFNGRVAAYTQRRDAYNTEFAAVIETRDHVRANIKELWRQEDCLREEEARLKKAIAGKWGDERTAGEAKLYDLLSRSNKLICAVLDEQCKFEDIQKAADVAFEDMAKRTLADGTVMTDEQLAEYNKTHPENV